MDDHGDIGQRLAYLSAAQDENEFPDQRDHNKNLSYPNKRDKYPIF